MINRQLLDFIKDQMQDDVDKEIISEKLLLNNWTTQDIEEAFRAIKGDYKFYEMFWFSWLVLFNLYSVYLLFSGNSILKKISSIIDIFIPGNQIFYFNNLIGATKGLFSLFLFIIFLIFADKLSKRLKINNTFLKLLFNLIVLFSLTLIIDVILHGQTTSLNLLFGM
jgi:hypothetical protein